MRKYVCWISYIQRKGRVDSQRFHDDALQVFQTSHIFVRHFSLVAAKYTHKLTDIDEINVIDRIAQTYCMKIWILFQKPITVFDIALLKLFRYTKHLTMDKYIHTRLKTI